MKKIKDHLIYSESCIDVMDSMEDESVNLILSDPPYLINYKTNHRKDKSSILSKSIDGDKTTDKYLIKRFFNRSYRILKNNSAIFIFFRIDKYNQFVPIAEKAGFDVKNLIVWKKNNWTAGDLVGALGYQYENILFASKGNFKIKGRRYTDVWEFDKVHHTKTVHNHQKPTELLIRAIKMSTAKGDVIFDGFGGSGSTLIACEKTERKCIICEKNPERYEIMIKHINDNLFKTEDMFEGII